MNSLPYYLDIDGETKGPFPFHEVQSLWLCGHVNDETLFCREGMTEWLPLQAIQTDLESVLSRELPPKTSATNRSSCARAEPDDSAEPPTTLAARRSSCRMGGNVSSAEKAKRDSGNLLGVLLLIAFILLAATFAVRRSSSASSESDQPVRQSAWDGSVAQVERYLKESVKDPASLEIIEWSPVEKVDSGYAVRCKYRAKNSFGGYVVENRVFAMDSTGRVLGSR